MKIINLLIIIAFSISIICCSGIEITENNVKKELTSVADSIRKNKKSVLSLDDRIIGKKGYFYIIRSNGKILYHPKKALINFDFSDYPFIKEILNRRNGCLSLNADGIQKYLFFSEIDSEEILCLSIDSSEFTGPVQGCVTKTEGK